ncbi:hypothetical protein R3X27_04045 [Tropicimonas sp. TH_r6]|uniref:hypothetical protein n=1 Tax=Tropicimonas sp. TH_r6 TaxID=3082085 RepID=UPI0029533668|nr:hypothetical protein [Tropicimonas sp. TH_r6]MDV7141848.1 hypothetical protein [Tropicimonas sp. TH_r6]
MTRLTKDLRQMMLARVVVITVLATSVLAAASIADAQQQGDRPEGPPPEAIEACAGKAVNDACSMTMRGKGETVSGQCTATPDKKIACLPEGAPLPPKS